MRKSDKDKIPKGFYCYSIKNNKYKYCPYFGGIRDKGILITYCKLLKLGDVGDITDKEFNILLKKYKTQQKIWEKYPLNFLWDSCKECGINEE